MLLIVSSKFIEAAGVIMLLPFRNNIKLKFVFVMIIYPMIFTSMQFWITDNIIKKSSTSTQPENEINNKNIYKDFNNVLIIKEIEEQNNKLIIEHEAPNESETKNYKTNSDSITEPLLNKI